MKKKTDSTTTTEFELDGIEEALAPAKPKDGPPGAPAGKARPWKQPELPRLEVERPPELGTPFEPQARVWIMERRARGLLAKAKRWMRGAGRGGKRGK